MPRNHKDTFATFNEADAYRKTASASDGKARRIVAFSWRESYIVERGGKKWPNLTVKADGRVDLGPAFTNKTTPLERYDFAFWDDRWRVWWGGDDTRGAYVQTKDPYGVSYNPAKPYKRDPDKGLQGMTGWYRWQAVYLVIEQGNELAPPKPTTEKPSGARTPSFRNDHSGWNALWRIR